MKALWDGENWTTTVALPKWKAHLNARLVRRVPVCFTPEAATEESRPSAAQLAAAALLVEKQEELLRAVTVALRRHYDRQRPMMLKVAAELPQYFPNFGRLMPPHPSASTFAKLHRLQQIYVQPTSVRKLAHVGFAFDAGWEMEHGIGVLTHRLAVREVGDADTVILEWIAKEDARKLLKAARTRRARKTARRQ